MPAVVTADELGVIASLFPGHTPDFLAGLITCLMTGLMVAGVKKSPAFNNFLNIVNFVVWCFIMFASPFFIDFNNWSSEKGSR